MGTAPTLAKRHAAIEGASRQARWTAGAFLVSAALVALDHTGAPNWLASELAGSIGLAKAVAATRQAPTVAGVLANVLFLVWIYRAVSNAAALGIPLKWGPGIAVLANLVPVVSLVLPYFVLKALHRASDPSALPDVPIFRERTAGTYRDGGRELVASPRWDLPAPLIAWWILGGARTFAGIAVVAHDRAIDWVLAFCQIAFDLLCVLVVRSIDARQRELCRRLEVGPAV